MPTDVMKTDQETGGQAASESGSSDSLTLNEVPNDARPLDLNRSASLPTTRSSHVGITPEEDAALAEVLGEAPGVFKEVIQELTDQGNQAMRMHLHYNDMALQGTNIELGTGAEETAIHYLRASIQATTIKANLTKTLITTMGKGNKAKKASKKEDQAPQQQGPVINVAPGGNVAVHFTSRREAITAAQKTGGSHDGTLSAQAVIVDSPAISSSATPDNNGNDNKAGTD